MRRTAPGGIQNARIGVGTTTPFATFSVLGNGYLSGNLTAANITATGTLAVSGQTTLANASTTKPQHRFAER